MKLFPVKNIYQCFQWLYLVLNLTGCLGFKLNKSLELYYDQWSEWYGYISRLIYVTGFVGAFLYKLQDEDSNQAMYSHLTPVVKFILCFEIAISTMVYLVVVFFMDTKRKNHLKLAQNLKKLDEQLLKDFPGIQWNYYKFSRKYTYTTLVLYLYYTVVSVIYIFNVTHCSRCWFSSSLISVSYSSITAAPGVLGILYVGVMDLFRIRFRLIRQLIERNLKGLNFKQRQHIKSLRKFKLLQYYFKEYSCLIVSLNDVFSFVTAAGIFHDFAVVTIMGFLLCSKALESKAKLIEYIFIMLFIAPRLYKVIMTAIYGYLAQKEKRNCSQEFVKMEYYFNKSIVVRDSLESFLHWRMHNNYYISVGKTLYCSLSLIFLVFNGIANYIMILIQLQFQQNNIVKRFLNRIDLYEDVEMIKT